VDTKARYVPQGERSYASPMGELCAVRPHVGEGFARPLAADSRATVRDVPQTGTLGSILRIDYRLDASAESNNASPLLPRS
jgi:hypothetical protein